MDRKSEGEKYRQAQTQARVEAWKLLRYAGRATIPCASLFTQQESYQRENAWFHNHLALLLLPRRKEGPPPNGPKGVRLARLYGSTSARRGSSGASVRGLREITTNGARASD